MEILLNKRSYQLIHKERRLGLVIIVIFETLLINGLIYFFFYVQQPNQNIYLELHPHPLLFLSLFIGLRYGIKLSLISALISSLFYIDVYIQLHGSLELFFRYFNNYKYPLLFLWGGVILGAFKDNHTRELKNADDEIKKLTKENYYLEKDFLSLETIYKDLKSQIIKSDETIVGLHDIAKKLESFEIEEIYTETIGILKKYLKATKLALYTLDRKQDFLRLKISYGDVIQNTSIVASTCSWLIELERERGVIKNPSYSDDTDTYLMAAPLISDKKIIAVVVIKSMEFDMISEYAFNLFQLIIDWINRSLEKASYVEHLTESKFLENTNLIKDPDYFEKQIKIEKRRKVEFGMEYSILAYRLENCEFKEIDTLVVENLRSMDLAYYNQEKNIIIFLLPATKRKNAILIEKRIEDNFGNKLVKINVASLQQEHSEQEDE